MRADFEPHTIRPHMTTAAAGSRARQLVTLLLAAASVLILAPAVGGHGPDVLVVGAGPAGLATALEAARNGARVTVVDMASVFGGHAVVSEGGLSFAGTPLQRSLGIADSPDQMFRDIVALGGDANEPWARVFAERGIAEVHDWLVSLGVRFTSVQQLIGNTVPRFHENPRRGFGVVEPLYRACLDSGAVEFAWNIRVTRLLVESGRVVGIEGRHERTGAVQQWRAPAVVLATGGFQSNLALVKAHWPQDQAVPARILIGSGVHAEGTGLDLARDAGASLARLDHQWNYPRGIVDPRYPTGERGLNVIFATRFPWVNGAGRRVYAELVSEMMAQPGKRVLLLLDAEGRADFRVSGVDWADRAKVEALLDNPAIARTAPTIDGLARLSNLPPDALAETVSRWNALVASGEDSDLGFFSQTKGTLASPTGVRPRPIKTPPFHAVEVSALTRKSMGGVVIDMDGRALDASNSPIPGLYAVGEVAGFGGLNGRRTIEGAFIAPAMLQGRIAARHIVKTLGVKAPAFPNESPPLPVPPAGAAAACSTCHAMDRLLAAPRAGYWHFERVHRAVGERGLDVPAVPRRHEPFPARAAHDRPARADRRLPLLPPAPALTLSSRSHIESLARRMRARGRTAKWPESC